MADNNKTSSLFSLAMLAYSVCNEVERDQYCEYLVPRFDIQQCCENVLEMIAVNTNSGQFHPHGDRQSVFKKLCSNILTKHLTTRYTGLCDAAAHYGHVNCMKIAQEMGCPWSTCTSEFAVRRDKVDCLKYAMENGCPADIAHTWIPALTFSSMECLRYLRENWGPETLEMAASGGHLLILRYVRRGSKIWPLGVPGVPAQARRCLGCAYLHRGRYIWGYGLLPLCSPSLVSGR
ncbi:hypothetical protein QTP88_028746 [Uroleucon formosanum]